MTSRIQCYLFAAVLFLCATFAHSQNLRWDLGAPGSAGAVTTSGAGQPFLVALPGVTLAWCNYPANAVPCTNYAGTYPSLTSTSACPSNTQIVLQGSSTCVATGDAFGNLGVYTPAGTYAYTLTVNGVSSGPFTATVGGSQGGGILFAEQFCQGSSDAGVCISNAIAALPAQGGIVYATSFLSPSAAATITINKTVTLYLPTGTFALSGNPGIDITGSAANGTQLIGQGVNATFISSTSGTADIMKVESTTNFVHWSDLTVRSSVARSGGCGLSVQGGNSKFERIRVNPVYNGICLQTINTADNNLFSDIWLANGGSGNAWNCGILTGGISSGTVASNQFVNVLLTMDTAFADAGVCLQDGTDSFSMINSQIVQGAFSSVALHMERINSGLFPEWTKFTAVYFEGGTLSNSIVIDAAREVDFDNCYSGGGLRGLLVNTALGLQWHGGIIYSNQQEGVRLLGGTGIDISGVRFGDNGQATNNTYDDIYVAANYTDFKLDGNIFAGIIPSPPSNHTKWNIEVLPGTSNNYDVLGNDFGSSVTGGFSDGGTGTNKNIFNQNSSVLTYLGAAGIATPRIMMTGTSPTCAFTSGGGSSPSCTLEAGSADTGGTIIATTGTGSPGTSGTITLTFTSVAPFGSNTPSCHYLANNNGAGTWGGLVTFADHTPSTTADLFNWSNATGGTPAGVALSASTAYRINYVCFAK